MAGDKDNVNFNVGFYITLICCMNFYFYLFIYLIGQGAKRKPSKNQSEKRTDFHGVPPGPARICPREPGSSKTVQNQQDTYRHPTESHIIGQRVTSEEENPRSSTRLGRLKARSGYVGPRALSGQACSSRRPRCPRVPRSGPPGPNIINIKIRMIKIKYIIKYKTNYKI